MLGRGRLLVTMLAASIAAAPVPEAVPGTSGVSLSVDRQLEVSLGQPATNDV